MPCAATHDLPRRRRRRAGRGHGQATSSAWGLARSLAFQCSGGPRSATSHVSRTDGPLLSADRVWHPCHVGVQTRTASAARVHRWLEVQAASVLPGGHPRWPGQASFAHTRSEARCVLHGGCHRVGSVPASTRLSVHWASTPFLCDQAPPAHAAGGQTPLWPHCQDGLPPRAPACTCHRRSRACVGPETQLTSRHVGPRQKTQGEGRGRGGGRRRASWRRRRAGGGAGAGFTGSACSRGPAGCSEEGRGYCALWTPFPGGHACGLRL